MRASTRKAMSALIAVPLFIACGDGAPGFVPGDSSVPMWPNARACQADRKHERLAASVKDVT